MLKPLLLRARETLNMAKNPMQAHDAALAAKRANVAAAHTPTPFPPAPGPNRAALTNAATADSAPDRQSRQTANPAAHSVKRGLHGNISDAGFIPGDPRNDRAR